MTARLASFVGTVQLRLKIEQATSTDDDPTPIYLLDETVQMMGINGKNVTDAVEIIQQRLQHRTPMVKQKTLRLVKHSALKGSPELRRALARQSAAVRELTHFRCAPDPFKGDIPWKRVQEAAREALDALHAAPSTQQASFASTSLGTRIQGFGSDSQGGSGMIGFGNDSLGAGNRSPLTGFAGGLAADKSHGAPTGGAMLGSLTTGIRDLSDRAVGAFTRPQHDRLASMDGNGADEELSSNKLGTSGYQAQNARLPEGRDLTASQVPSTSASREEKLVDRICKPSGLRAAPSSEDLRAFVNAASQLHGPGLATALQAKISKGSWQESLRALCALETLLERSTASPAAGEVAVHFQGPALGDVRRARQSTQATVKQRAERVLRLLGEETLPSPTAVSGNGASAVASREQQTMDLLGDADMDPMPKSRLPSVTATTPFESAEDPTLLLSELSLASQPASSSTVDPFAVDVAASNASTTASSRHASPLDSVFGDWTAPTTTNVPALHQEALPSTQPLLQPPRQGGMDLLGGRVDLTVTPTAPQPTRQAEKPVGGIPLSADLFGSCATSGQHSSVLGAHTLGSPRGRSQQVSLDGLAPMGMASGVPQTVGRANSRGSAGDAFGVRNAAASGISNAKREDAAFESLVAGALAGMKK